jgi:hypothetical protein
LGTPFQVACSAHRPHALLARRRKALRRCWLVSIAMGFNPWILKLATMPMGFNPNFDKLTSTSSLRQAHFDKLTSTSSVTQLSACYIQDLQTKNAHQNKFTSSLVTQCPANPCCNEALLLFSLSIAT